MTNPAPPFRRHPDPIPRNLGRRIRRLELGDVGLWHYVIDLSPPVGANKWGIPTTGNNLPSGGSIPPDCLIMEAAAGDIDTVTFQNGWHNVPLADGTYHPLAYRMHPPTKIQLSGVIGLGKMGTTMCVLPTWAWPRFNIRGVELGVDDSTRFGVTVSAVTGAVVVVGEIT